MKNTSIKRRVFLGSALAGVLALGTAVYAGPHCKKGGKHHGAKFSQQDKAEFMQKRFDRMSAKLSLTDEQKTGMQALMQNHRNAMKPLRNEKRGLRTEMKNLDPASVDYAAKLADIANRQAELVRQMTIAKGNRRQQVSQILTPEQLAKKQEMRAKHGKRRGMRHYRGQ